MILKFILVSMICLLVKADAPLPFWKAKKDIYARMKEERYIPVSAKSSDVDKEKKLTVVAAGLIHAPVEFTHGEVLKFDEYPKFLSYILESPYDKSTKNVFLHGAVMGYHVQMTVHIDVEKNGDDEKIKWKSISGGFQGMSGIITETPTDKEHTEISLDSSYQGKTLAIPQFILNWGLEFAAQRTAAAIRSHIESEWERSKKH